MMHGDFDKQTIKAAARLGLLLFLYARKQTNSPLLIFLVANIFSGDLARLV